MVKPGTEAKTTTETEIARQKGEKADQLDEFEAKFSSILLPADLREEGK